MCRVVERLSVMTLVGMFLSMSIASGEVLLPSGEPDPGYNNSAMQVWLRADRGIIAEDGLMSKWKDQSTHGRHATQSKVADRPRHEPDSLNHRDVVKFGGGGDHLKFATGFDKTFDGSFTIFAVIAPDDGDPDRDDVWFGLIENSTKNRVILATDGNNDGFAALYKAEGNSDNVKVVPNPFPDGLSSTSSPTTVNAASKCSTRRACRSPATDSKTQTNSPSIRRRPSFVGTGTATFGNC